VLPAAVSLQKQGANKGATTAFLISTPESGVDSIAIVDKGRLMVNKGRLMVNGQGWTATEDVLYNKGRLMVNGGNVAIDIDTTLLYDYQDNQC